MYTTYAIIDPVDLRPVYVGQTRDFERRQRDHCAAHRRRDIKKGTVQEWLKSLHAQKLSPLFLVLEVVETEAESLNSETKWCEKYASIGLPLFNGWEEHRQTIAAAYENCSDQTLRAVVFSGPKPVEVGQAVRNRNRTGWRISLKKGVSLGDAQLTEDVTIDLVPPKDS